jgi:hypothetical protein
MPMRDECTGTKRCKNVLLAFFIIASKLKLPKCSSMINRCINFGIFTQ